MFGINPIVENTVIEDDFREEQLKYLTSLSLKYPL
jgi:hypothetical protein